MATATFNGVVIAESDDIEIVEGNPYFPISSLRKECSGRIRSPHRVPLEGHGELLDDRGRRRES